MAKWVAWPYCTALRYAVRLVATVLLLASAAGADDLERLKQIEAEIEANRGKLADAERQARELADAIAASERRRAELEEAVRKARRRRDELGAEARRLTLEITQLERTLAKAKRDAARAAAWALSLNRGGNLELVLATSTPQERMVRDGSARATNLAVQRYVAAVANQRRELSARQAQIAANRAEQERLAIELEAQAAAARERRAQAERSLELVRRDADLTRGMLDDLSAAREELARIIAEGRSRRRSVNEAFGLLKGALTPPLEAPLLMGFGTQRDPVFEVTIEHPGWTYRVRQGTPVKAVAAGTVAYAGWLRGYGNLVVIDHGDDYFSLYGYLGEVLVARGSVVDAGMPVGLSGDSGSIYGAALHFELRHRSEPLDPGQWLLQ